MTELMTAHRTCCRTEPMALRHEAEAERWVAREHRQVGNARHAARCDRAADRLTSRARAAIRSALLDIHPTYIAAAPRARFTPEDT